ncbi:MAG: tetratricopeptide repeat protein [Gemmatimonadota bacterium]|nr:MAG: tetratricopeptide repeat protein [Gemmatimonadota bacterium]
MDESGSRLRAFVAELRRRRVFRVVVVYAAVAFVIWQAAEIAFEALSLPPWALTLVVVATLLGFPVAMVLAWAFDITPRGVVRTEPLEEVAGPYRQPGRPLALIAVVAVLALAVAAALYVLPRMPGWGGALGSEARSGSALKLLVLPFENLGAPIDEYFADGITEEITARLASLPGLGVIARTTAVRYRGTEKTVAEIGEELGIDYILEGTVRWEDVPDGPNRVRVTPQLIKVEDGTHAWAEIYEEPIESVFEVQSEIAERVAEALDLTLLEPERLALKTAPTTNLEAYRYYLLGDEYLRTSASRTSAQQALEMFERAVELDPEFELARRKLAEAHANIYWGSFRMLTGVRELDYEDALFRLYPESFGTDSGSYYLAKAILHERAGQEQLAVANFESARAVLEARVAARPEDARLHAELGLAFAGLGMREEAVRAGRQAVELLPLAEDAYAGGALADNLAHIYVRVGDYDAAIDQLEALLAADAPLSVPWLSADPTWDRLGEESRFQRLVQGGG